MLDVPWRIYPVKMWFWWSQIFSFKGVPLYSKAFEKCLLNKSPANVIWNWGGASFMWNYAQRSFAKGFKRGKVFGEEFMCIHGNTKEKNVWKCGLARIKRTLVIHLYGKMRQECTQMFLVLKKTVKKREYVSLVGVVFHWGSSILPVLHCRLTLKLSCQATWLWRRQRFSQAVVFYIVDRL